MNMVEKRAWQEFKESGFLWWINRILHTFGWAIVYQVNEEDTELIDVFPARVKFRGFGKESEELGFQRITNYISGNAAELLEDLNE